MNVIVPIKNKDYVDIFANAGADEFYGSCVYEAWERHFGTYTEFNRRGNYGIKANCTEKEFFEIVSHSANRGLPFYLTMNALRITDEQVDYLFPLLENFHNAGGYGVIISDISLIDAVKKLDLKIVISSCAEVINSTAAAYYRDLGCDRIILPRTMTIEEINSIKKNVPELQYEVFFLNSGCRFTDGNCLCSHKKPMGELCKYCDENAEGFYERFSHSLTEEKELIENEVYFAGLLQKACAFCSLYDLYSVADSIKIVERVADEEKILWQLKLTKHLVKVAEQSTSTRDYLMHMRFPDDSHKRCQKLLNCYYRTDLLKMVKIESNALSRLYYEFKKNIRFPFETKYIDYIGINTTVNSETPFIFKLYYAPEICNNISHKLITLLSEMDMIRYFTCIQDNNVTKQKIRFDIGLRKRTDDNIIKLLDILESYANYFRSRRTQVEMLSKMKITDSVLESLASLYFVGLIEENHRIKNLKFHFLNRWCESSDVIGKNHQYKDRYYIQFLRKLDIPELQHILDLIECVLSEVDGHLWMTGVDYEVDGKIKYKQYVKCSSNTLLCKLIDYCRKNSRWNGIVWQLIEIYDWYQHQNELTLDGFAACESTIGALSFNFYFRIKK